MTEHFGANHGRSLERFLEYLVYLFVRLSEEIICLIPTERMALTLGVVLGRIMFVVARDRRRVAAENLSIAFGKELTPSQIQALARKNFEHLGMLTVEFFRLRRWNHAQLADKIVLRGQENFNRARRPGNRGLLVVMAHFGSFEVLAAMCRFVGTRVNLVVTPVPNKFVNERMIFKRGGNDSGLHIIPHRGIVRTVVDALRSGEMVVVLADQRGDDARPVWVDFFGKKVLANGVFAKFALEGEAYVMPLRGLRTADGRYICEFGEEIPIEVTGDREWDVTVTSQRFHEIFESWLREVPEQGFWMHRKFRRKTRRPKAKRTVDLQPSHAEYTT